MPTIDESFEFLAEVNVSLRPAMCVSQNHIRHVKADVWSAGMQPINVTGCLVQFFMFLQRAMVDQCSVHLLCKQGSLSGINFFGVFHIGASAGIFSRFCRVRAEGQRNGYGGCFLTVTFQSARTRQWILVLPGAKTFPGLLLGSLGKFSWHCF